MGQCRLSCQQQGNSGKDVLPFRSYHRSVVLIKRKKEKKMSTANNSKKEVSVPLLAFTFFYSVTIYTVLLSFYFWQWRKDIKPEK